MCRNSFSACHQVQRAGGSLKAVKDKLGSLVDESVRSPLESSEAWAISRGLQWQGAWSQGSCRQRQAAQHTPSDNPIILHLYITACIPTSLAISVELTRHFNRKHKTPHIQKPVNPARRLSQHSTTTTSHCLHLWVTYLFFNGDSLQLPNGFQQVVGHFWNFQSSTRFKHRVPYLLQKYFNTHTQENLKRASNMLENRIVCLVWKACKHFLNYWNSNFAIL